MKKTIQVVLLIAMIAGAIAGYFYWQYHQETPPASPPAPLVQQPSPPPPAPTESIVQYPVEALPAQPEATVTQTPSLPTLADSDAAMHEALTGLLTKKHFALFYPDQIIRRIVATIDNLPRKKAPIRLMPVKPVPGQFATQSAGEKIVISGGNSARYAPYVRLSQGVDTSRLIAVYVHLYPLFQQAYQDLGYPNGYFNDRLVEVIDHLLASPEVTAPIEVVQSKVLYEFADPELEALSAGQKIMIRMGNKNAAIIKKKLQEIRQRVTKTSGRRQ